MDRLSRQQVSELTSAILARGLSLEGVSEASGLTQKTVLEIMHGKLRPSPYIRQRLAHALGIDPGLIKEK